MSEDSISSKPRWACADYDIYTHSDSWLECPNCVKIYKQDEAERMLNLRISDMETEIARQMITVARLNIGIAALRDELEVTQDELQAFRAYTKHLVNKPNCDCLSCNTVKESLNDPY